MSLDDKYPSIWPVKRRYPIGIRVRVLDAHEDQFLGMVGDLKDIDESDQETTYYVYLPSEDHTAWVYNVEPYKPVPQFQSKEDAERWLTNT